MKRANVTSSLFVAASLSAIGIASAAQDPLAMNSPNGIAFNGKPVPDGATYVKIEWQKEHETSPYAVTVPGDLAEVAFTVKDFRRFPDTNGWGYATLTNDASSDTWKPKGTDVAFGKAECRECHTVMKASDHLFTQYPTW